MDRLWISLPTVQPGKITNTTGLEPLLAACWDEFSGDHGGMVSGKLLGGMVGGKLLGRMASLHPA